MIYYLIDLYSLHNATISAVYLDDMEIQFDVSGSVSSLNLVTNLLSSGWHTLEIFSFHDIDNCNNIDANSEWKFTRAGSTFALTIENLLQCMLYFFFFLYVCVYVSLTTQIHYLMIYGHQVCYYCSLYICIFIYCVGNIK